MNTRGLSARLRYRFIKSLRGATAASRAFGVTIGEDCRILSNIVTTEPWLIEVGDRVTVSTSVRFVTHDGTGWLVRDDRGRRYRYAPIKVGSDVFIGVGATVMPGVEIGDRCVVAAGAVVTRSVPAGCVVAGVPARIVGDWDSLMRKIGGWAAEDDLKGATYRERVDSIVDLTYNPPLQRHS